MLPVSISFQDAAPHLRQGSSVIIISSIAGYNPEKGLTMYGVTKTALLGLTKVYVHLLFFVIFHFVCYMTGVCTMGTPRKAPPE